MTKNEEERVVRILKSLMKRGYRLEDIHIEEEGLRKHTIESYVVIDGENFVIYVDDE
jgi:hypothetical protein